MIHSSDMKLVKYYGRVEYAFNTEKILRVKNTDVFDDDVVARTDTTVYTFHQNEKYISICSLVDKYWDKDSVVKTIEKIVGPGCKSKCVDKSFIFESKIYLGEGGPELLHWLLIKNNRDDVLLNIYEPELNDALIVHFKIFNDVSITSHIFIDGKVVHICVPNGSMDVELVKKEASLIDEIFKKIIN